MPGMPQGVGLLATVAVVDFVFFAHACSLIGWKAALRMFLIGNYAGTMAIIELYAMGATFAIAFVKWVDWLRST